MTTSPILRQGLAAVRMLLVLTLLLGVAYPAAVWGVSWLGLRDQAQGSLVSRDGTVVGSSLLGQPFTDPGHFTSRPSASDYAGDSSGGSNLAASDADQQQAVTERRGAYAAANGGAQAPPDAVTASASGLDPHVSPQNAGGQVDRVAAATGLGRDVVADLVARHTQGRVLGFLGDPRVNVLELNLAVDDADAAR